MSIPRAWTHLLSPGRIGPMETRNRIAMSPMGSNLAEEDGHVGERLQRYYEERARGGVGLVIVGVGAVSFPAGACIPRQVALSDDAFLPGLRALTERIHAHGARVAIQLQHAGKVATQDIAAGRPLWVPSPLPPKPGDLFVDLTPEEIQGVTGYLARPSAKLELHAMTAGDTRELVDRFAEAADRARRAGFDGVEIHAAHGYLLSSFLSPASNQRDDPYGGSVENRARLLVEVIQAVRRRVGRTLAVWCRLDAREFRIENGITPEDARRTAELAEAAGLDAIHVSAYADPSCGAAFTEAPLVHEPGGYLALAEAIKRRVHVPVIAVGRIDPKRAERALRTGQADFVAMGRALLADPELPRKLAQGRPEDVRPCIYCYRCVGQIYLNQPVRCAVNPATGHEAEFEVVPAANPRRVLVVGGGPAGMEVARVAAVRGHRVTLCEKQRRLGGTARLAALVYPENQGLVDYLETQVRKLPVDLRLGREVTAALVRELRPEVVIVAVGAHHESPTLPGVHRAEVLSGADLHALLDGGRRGARGASLSLGRRLLVGIARGLGIIPGRPALTRLLTRSWMPLGARVVVVGGGLVGIELAEFLSERGRTVTVLEPGSRLAVEMALPRRWRVLERLRRRGVQLRTGARVAELGEDGVVFFDETGARQAAAADSVILAHGVHPDPTLAETLSGQGFQVHRVGDCRDVGYLEGAMADAARMARVL